LDAPSFPTRRSSDLLSGPLSRSGRSCRHPARRRRLAHRIKRLTQGRSMAQGRTGAATSQTGIRIGLSAVIIALRDREAAVLTTHAPDGAPALPFGPFDPARDRTFELALRAFVAAQTGFPLGFVEQLYTFGDLGRDAPRATPGPDQAREISVGYLALTADAHED